MTKEIKYLCPICYKFFDKVESFENWNVKIQYKNGEEMKKEITDVEYSFLRFPCGHEPEKCPVEDVTFEIDHEKKVIKMPDNPFFELEFDIEKIKKENPEYKDYKFI
jgi:hypothetical protein